MRTFDRPTEEQAAIMTDRRDALRRNLATLNSDFERLLILLLLIGFKRREIAEFEVGISRTRVAQIINRGAKRFNAETPGGPPTSKESE